MNTLKAECIIDAKALLGEGPVWDEKLEELIWLDIEGYKLHRYRPKDGDTLEYKLKQKAGAAVPAEDGSWILAMQDGFYRFDLETGQANLILQTNEPEGLTRLNDGKCDPSGRFWAGSISSNGEKIAALYTLETDSILTNRLSPVTISNGLAWSQDVKTMYYIDSGEKVVSAFDYDAVSGEITNRRTVITFLEGEGGPDGMSIDVEGMLWIGHWDGGQLSRWNPHTGKKLAQVELPVRHVTSCAFGGPDMDELYITTARIAMDEQALEKYPLAGGLFRVKVGVKGLPVHRYKN
jgi:sugar lactone lactonase YvrE